MKMIIKCLSFNAVFLHFSPHITKINAKIGISVLFQLRELD